jgi:hypothetical protein
MFFIKIILDAVAHNPRIGKGFHDIVDKKIKDWLQQAPVRVRRRSSNGAVEVQAGGRDDGENDDNREDYEGEDLDNVFTE